MLGIGAYSMEWIKKHVGTPDPRDEEQTRTPKAIYSKMLRDFGKGGLLRGSITLSQASKDTGYTVKQLRRACKALQQRWVRTTPTGAWMLSEDQLKEACDWLKHDYWVKKLCLYGCLQCAGTQRLHFANGLCTPCYNQLRRFAKARGLPFALRELLRIVEELRPTARPNEIEFLDQIQIRLDLGRALLRPDLVHLGRLWRGYRNEVCKSGEAGGSSGG